MQSTLTKPTQRTSAGVEQLKVLLVDDIPANLLTLEGILENDTRLLIKAFSGNEALKLLMEEPIDLILLDIQMPGMDGIEVAQLLRANSKTKHIPIIFVSAIAKSERPSFAEFEPGTFDFIPKPLDITETNKIVAMFEQTCRYRRQVLQHQDTIKKLNEHLEKFLYILSHDLNAPLRAIDNLVNWLEEDEAIAASEETQENLGLLRNRVNKMKLMLDGLLDYAKAGKNTPLKESFSIEETCYRLLEAIDDKKDSLLTVNTQPPVITTDKQALTRVMNELLKNAICFNSNPSPTVDVTVINRSGQYEFVISDNGPGIKPQQQHVVFDIFQTLQSSDQKQTAGVGLAIVKKLVEDRGGRIWFDSAYKSGTQIHFTWKE